MWSFSQTFKFYSIYIPPWHFSSIKGIMTAHEGFYRKHFQEEEKKTWHWLHCYNQGPWPKNLSLLTQNKWCLPFPTLSSSILPQKRSKSSPFQSCSQHKCDLRFCTKLGTRPSSICLISIITLVTILNPDYFCDLC